MDAVRAHVGGRGVLAAVKANAYGHGAVKVARMIERTGCADWLGVALVSEAQQLREAGVGLPILKFSHPLDASEAWAAVLTDITLAVVDAASIDLVAEASRRAGRRASVHLKVDTGMGRIGCRPEDAVDLARRVDAAGLELGGVFSHLPVADLPDGDSVEFTRAQAERFAAVCDAIEAARGPVQFRHLANSGAVLQHPQAWFDMVRPGIMIYGSLPDADCAASVPLEPVVTWTTRVSFVKDVAAGESIGYGRSWVAPHATKVATLPIGYGDGYSRLLSGRGRVLIGGRAYPLVGRVCMDQVMVDLGADGGVSAGDEVVLIGRSGAEQITVSEIAEQMGTIPYEVTCLITPRVGRKYAEPDG